MELSSCVMSFDVCSIDPCVHEGAFVHKCPHQLFDSLVTMALFGL